MRSESMYIHFPALPEPVTNSTAPSEDTNAKTQKKEKNNPSIKTKTSVKKPILDQEAKRVMQLHLLSKTRFLIQNEIFELAGISSGSQKIKIKKYLINKGWYKEHRLQKGRNKVVILEPLSSAYKVCNVPERSFPSKGGYLHQFCCHRILNHYKQKDYQFKIEYFLSNNKAVDLVLQKDKELIFIEIGISSAQNELENAVKNLSTELIPSSLIMACRDTQMKKALEKLVRNDPRLDTYRKIITTELAGNFIQTNKEKE